MLWIKSFHIIAMVTWFAGLFYLPRLYVYHADVEDTLSHERFKIMERRLYFGIMWPGALLTTILGLWLMLLYLPYTLKVGWMHAKLMLVVLLWMYHWICGYYLNRFKNGANVHTSRFYRIFNEIPTFFLISIVLLVVLKPSFL